MSLTTASHDSLPYIDRPPSPTSLLAAKRLISSSLPPSAHTTPHPLLPPSPTPHFSDLITLELSRVQKEERLTAIDLSRYEAPPLLSPSIPAPSALQALKAAYTNSAYLTKRLQALELLEQYGKNAWLVGNAQLEDVLRGVEREVVECRGRVEEVNRERRGAQEGGKGRLEGGERVWREEVGRALEAEVAAGEVEAEWRRVLREGGRGR
ncbi:hypothetical protein MMC21_001662 [Puttea exsequens]|nr:hypothetical protein [Puttea exsequens]